jgi:type IX secretion system PorP/SprF family membrane protein
MIKYLRISFIVILVIPLKIFGQDTGSGLNYQMTMINNPAITGSEGDGLIRLSYFNFYPGNSYNMHSFVLSYDGYFPSLHGGAGFYLSDSYLGGLLNDLKGGFSYSYFFQAGENIYISAGLSGSFYNRGFNFNGAVLPDQINPLGGIAYNPGEVLIPKGKTIFDLGTGFLFMTPRIFWGIAVNHLAEPDLSNNDFAPAKLMRQILLNAAGDIEISAEKKLKLCPFGKIEISKKFLSLGAGASFESNYLSISSLLLTDNSKNLDIQTGFSIKTGSLVFFYNYRFNIVSGNSLLPFSILHHTGIALRLNNVDKRKIIKTINFPKL